eukprot:98448-Prymnesium_polylepis.3
MDLACAGSKRSRTWMVASARKAASKVQAHSHACRSGRPRRPAKQRGLGKAHLANRQPLDQRPPAAEKPANGHVHTSPGEDMEAGFSPSSVLGPRGSV